MNMKMQSVGFKADKKLEAFINQKLSKLNKFDNNISDYNVTLNIENSDPKANKVVEVKVKVPGNEKVVFAANTTPPMPAQVAPRAKARSLVLALSMPID